MSTEASSSAGPRVLVYETSSRNLRVLRRCLRALGYEVVAVADGERLKLEIRAEEPQAIVASADVNGGTGLDVIRDIYSEASRPVPVVAFSARLKPEQIVESAPVELLLGAVLSSPLDPAELARAITKVVPPPNRALAAKVLDDLVKDVGQVGARLDPPADRVRLDETPMAVLLWAIDFNDWTGSLHVVDAPRGGLTLWCEFGQLVFAKTGRGRDVIETALQQERLKESAVPDVPLRNLQDEVGLLMALRAIGMHEVDGIVHDTVVRLVGEALGLERGLVNAKEGDTSKEELEGPLSLPTLMARAGETAGGSAVESLNPTSSLIVRLPPPQVVDGWGFTGFEGRILALLRESQEEETTLGVFLDRCGSADPGRRAKAVGLLSLLRMSGFLDIQGRAFDPETERQLSELVALIHRANRGSKYEALGLAVGAGEAEIKEAARALAKRYHPDTYATASPRVRATAGALFSSFQEAYTTLKNPETRDEYRQTVSGGEATASVRSTRSDPALAKVALHKAKRLLDKKNYAQALKLLRDASLHDAQNADARVLLGWTRYLIEQDAGVATGEIEKALRIDPRSAEAWFYLGRIAMLQKDPARAQKRYKKALGFNPDHLEAQREPRLLERRAEEVDKKTPRESGIWARDLFRRLSGKQDDG